MYFRGFMFLAKSKGSYDIMENKESRAIATIAKAIIKIVVTQTLTTFFLQPLVKHSGSTWTSGLKKKLIIQWIPTRTVSIIVSPTRTQLSCCHLVSLHCGSH